MTYESGGQKWQELMFLKVQLCFFALTITPALFDPVLTLYLKFDYHEYIMKSVELVYRNVASVVQNGGKFETDARSL